MAVALTLKVFKGDQLLTEKQYERDIIKIGRLASAHLCLDDDKVSRIHSVIEVGPDGLMSIIDMGSVEGTFVNGKRVNKGALAFGDEIKIGGTTIRVGAAEAASGDSAKTQAGIPVLGDERPSASIGPTGSSPAMTIPVAAAVATPVAAVVAKAAAPVVQNEATGRVVREAPRRRAGSGPLGLELRFRWGDQIVGEYFLQPGGERSFTVGTDKGVNFEMGDSKFESGSFQVVKFGAAGAQLRFTSSMNGELIRRNGEETITLERARSQRVAEQDGGAYVLNLSNDDFAWVDLGAVVLEVFFQPVPKAVFVPFSETVDFTALNIFLVMFFLGALFVITAANRDTEGDEYADELNDNNARMAKLLIKPPEPVKASSKEKKDSGEKAEKHKGDDGKMGKKDAPVKSAHAAPKAIDPNNKDQARLLMAKVFGSSSGGISTIFGHQGLGGELKSAMGNMFGAAAGDSGGMGGMGLRGSGSGGGGLGDTIGIGGIGTRGRGGGTGGYGSGVGVLGGKRDIDIGITSSEPTVMGSLDKELIRKVIHANRGQVRYCYESQLTRFPKLEGKVAIKFVISAGGTVASSTVAQSTVNNAELESCIAGRVRTWIFPKPKGGGIGVVTYPFIFKQSGT